MIAVVLDGPDGQYLAKSNIVTNLDIENTWTLGFWVKPEASKESAAIFSTGLDGKNEIEIYLSPLEGETRELGKRPTHLYVIIKDSDGSTIKHYGWGDHFEDNTWVHTAVVWDGTDLLAFKDGIATTTGVTFVNSAGAMSDSPDRKVFYGSTANQLLANFSGTIGHFAIWGSEITQVELGTVVSGGFSSDLTVASGTYSSQANLKHYWKPGTDPSDIGKDFASTANKINIGDDLRKVGSTNIISESP